MFGNYIFIYIFLLCILTAWYIFSSACVAQVLSYLTHLPLDATNLMEIGWIWWVLLCTSGVYGLGRSRRLEREIGLSGLLVFATVHIEKLCKDSHGLFISNKTCPETISWKTPYIQVVFTRPCVAGVVLQTHLSLIHFIK